MVDQPFLLKRNVEVGVKSTRPCARDYTSIYIYIYELQSKLLKGGI